MPNNFTLITGASSGIGKAAALRLSQNTNIILAGRNTSSLKEVLHLCSNPNNHIIWQIDLSNVGLIKESLKALIEDKGLVIDNFVHCAGMMKVMNMRSVEYANALQIFNVNFFSAAEIIALLLTKKVNQQSLKNILFVSAILARYGAKGHNLYSATKAALDGLMRSLATELAPQVRVNSVLPGAVDTPMAAAVLADSDLASKLSKDYPLGIGHPSDIADIIEFLISEKARWLTGQEFIIDGGRTINMTNR
jgi:NAD(P)-dependent dehydrogenase (short-subunit alcohol dehydrogenase family)